MIVIMKVITHSMLNIIAIFSLELDIKFSFYESISFLLLQSKKKKKSNSAKKIWKKVTFLHKNNKKIFNCRNTEKEPTPEVVDD